MGKMIIKKEDIKKDITIVVENNNFITGLQEFNFISFIDGELKINLDNFTLIRNDILENYTLKKDFLDKRLEVYKKYGIKWDI